MQTGIVNSACPRCGLLHAVPAAMAGQAYTCQRCRLMFLATPATPASLATPPAGPMPPHLLPGSQVSPQVSTAEVLSQDTCPPATSRPISSSGAWLKLTLFFLITAVALGGVGLAWFYWKGKDSLPARIEASPIPERPETIVEVLESSRNPPRWSDASDVSLLLHGVKVRVNQVELAEIFAKDDQHHVLSTDDKKHLVIYVAVKNLGQEPIDYHSWYALGGRTATRLQPRLTDGAGHTFPVKKFADVAQIKGHTPTAKLGTNDEINDAIIFRVPDDVPRDEVQFLRLQLPAAAFGGEGSYRFEIPRSMVAGW